MIELELEEFFFSLGCLQTSKRGFVFAPRENELGTRFWEEKSTVLQSLVADFGLWLHSLLGFEDSSSILKLFKI